MIDKDEECLLIADDSVLAKKHSKKIDLANYQYSGNVHDVIAGIGLINLLWYGVETTQTNRSSLYTEAGSVYTKSECEYFIPDHT